VDPKEIKLDRFYEGHDRTPRVSCLLFDQHPGQLFLMHEIVPTQLNEVELPVRNTSGESIFDEKWINTNSTSCVRHTLLSYVVEQIKIRKTGRDSNPKDEGKINWLWLPVLVKSLKVDLSILLFKVTPDKDILQLVGEIPDLYFRAYVYAQILATMFDINNSQNVGLSTAEFEILSLTLICCHEELNTLKQRYFLRDFRNNGRLQEILDYQRHLIGQVLLFRQTRNKKSLLEFLEKTKNLFKKPEVVGQLGIIIERSTKDEMFVSQGTPEELLFSEQYRLRMEEERLAEQAKRMAAEAQRKEAEERAQRERKQREEEEVLRRTAEAQHKEAEERAERERKQREEAEAKQRDETEKRKLLEDQLRAYERVFAQMGMTLPVGMTPPAAVTSDRQVPARASDLVALSSLFQGNEPKALPAVTMVGEAVVPERAQGSQPAVTAVAGAAVPDGVQQTQPAVATVAGAVIPTAKQPVAAEASEGDDSVQRACDAKKPVRRSQIRMEPTP
jgi:hypothetical protein